MSTILPIVSRHVVRASAALTDSYVAGTVFSIDNHNTIGVIVDYTKGTETSMEIKVEISDSTGYGQQVTESGSSGSITTDVAEYTLDATSTATFTIRPVVGDLVRISVKGTGTVTGTAAVRAVASFT